MSFPLRHCQLHRSLFADSRRGRLGQRAKRSSDRKFRSRHAHRGGGRRFDARFNRGCKKNVDFLIVHHGLFWPGLQPIQGALRRQLRIAFENDMALYRRIFLSISIRKSATTHSSSPRSD